jgi:hypothetical protein
MDQQTLIAKGLDVPLEKTFPKVRHRLVCLNFKVPLEVRQQLKNALLSKT